MKFKVLKQCTLKVEKDSIVELDQRQADIALKLGLVSSYKVQQKKTTTKKGE